MAIEIITTVGISGIINKFKDEKLNKFLSDLKRENYTTKLKEIIPYNYKLQKNETAEIQTLFKIFEKYDKDVKFIIHLLTTDTNESEFCANYIKELLKGYNNIKCDNIKRIENLVVDDYNKFRDYGVKNLLNEIKEIKNNCKENKNKLIASISGGFKGIIPILTTINHLYGIKSYYIFENSGVLIEIPSIPFDFDIFYMYENYDLCENLKNIDKFNEIELLELKEHGLIDNEKKLTIFGELLKQSSEKKLPYLINVWSRVIEHLIFEYFVMNKYKINNTTLNFVAKNYKLEGTEFDNVLGQSKDKIKVTVEIKPLKLLFIKERIEKFYEQIKRQNIQLQKNAIEEHILFFYSMKEKYSDIIKAKKIKEKINEIKKIYNKYRILLKIYFLSIEEILENIYEYEKRANEENRFANILKYKLKEADLIEIKI